MGQEEQAIVAAQGFERRRPLAQRQVEVAFLGRQAIAGEHLVVERGLPDRLEQRGVVGPFGAFRFRRDRQAVPWIGGALASAASRLARALRVHSALGSLIPPVVCSLTAMSGRNTRIRASPAGRRKPGLAAVASGPPNWAWAGGGEGQGQGQNGAD